MAVAFFSTHSAVYSYTEARIILAETFAKLKVYRRTKYRIFVELGK
jgi:hypothetical protein